jgi:hypothetical protein
MQKVNTWDEITTLDYSICKNASDDFAIAFADSELAHVFEFAQRIL